MQHLTLLGLPYVQPVHSGVLLLRTGRKPICTLRIYRFGSVLFSGSMYLNRSMVTLADSFCLSFPERPSKLTFMAFVEADFGPRISYIAYPINCVFPTIKEGTKFFLRSRDIYPSVAWGNIISQLIQSVAEQQVLLKRKLKVNPPNTYGS